MNKYMKSIAILIFLLSAVCSADVFRHRTSDEVFYGYPTQRTSREKTQIYAYENEKFVGRSINIDEYNVEYSSLGRKKNVRHRLPPGRTAAASQVSPRLGVILTHSRWVFRPGRGLSISPVRPAAFLPLLDYNKQSTCRMLPSL